MNHPKKPIVTFNSKKGISIMIGYVLLVTFAIIIGGILYNWMKTYVPKEALDCPEGVSIFVEEVICQGGNLNLTLRNNGRFDIGGYFIHATDETNQELATIDLSEYLAEGGTIRSNSIVFDLDENSMEPTETKKSIFILPFNINSIEIIPVRFQIQDNKQRFVSCGNSKIREIVNCGGTLPGVPAECGDGNIEGTEACDDGDIDNGDGCSSTCTIETNWTCTGEPSSCVENLIDLTVIINSWYEPSNKLARINFTISNIGSVAAGNFVWNATDSDSTSITPIGEIITSLNAGDSIEKSVDITYQVGGSYTPSIIVDTNNEIIESDETNNENSTTVNV